MTATDASPLEGYLAPEDRQILSIIKASVRSLFRQGSILCPHMVLHGPEHSEAVVANLCELLKDFMMNEHRLNSKEVFCLLAAAWLHDVGMQLARFPGEDCASVRSDHEKRSEEYVTDPTHDLGLADDPPARRFIGLICRGHRVADLAADDYRPRPFGMQMVRTGLLAALLRIADELHVDYRRAPETLRPLMAMASNDVSRLHWLQHHYVQGRKVTMVADPEKRVIFCLDVVVPDREHEDVLIKRFLIEKITGEIRTIEPVLTRGSYNEIRVAVTYEAQIVPTEERLTDDVLNYVRYFPYHPFPYEVELDFSSDLTRLRAYVDQEFRLGRYKDVCYALIKYVRTSVELYARRTSWADLSSYIRNIGSLFFPRKLSLNLGTMLDYQGIEDFDEEDCQVLCRFFNQYVLWVTQKSTEFYDKARQNLQTCEGLDSSAIPQNVFAELVHEAVQNLLAAKFVELTAKEVHPNEIWGWAQLRVLFEHNYRDGTLELLGLLKTLEGGVDSKHLEAVRDIVDSWAKEKPLSEIHLERGGRDA